MDIHQMWGQTGSVSNGKSHTHQHESNPLDAQPFCEWTRVFWLPKTYFCFAPWWWKRDRRRRSAAGAWTRTAVWERRRSIWRDGSAEQSPAQCRLQLAPTSAGPDSSSRGSLQPGSCGEKEEEEDRQTGEKGWVTLLWQHKQTFCAATQTLRIDQSHPKLLSVF